MEVEISKRNSISRHPKHTKGCDSQSFVLIKPPSLRYKARKSSIRAADLPHPSHTTDLLRQPRRMLTPTAKLPALRSVWDSGHRGMDDLETPPGGGTHPMGIRQSRALLFSIILELISPGLLALLRDIVSTLNMGKKVKLLPLLPCYAHGDCSARTDRCLDNIIPYQPTEVQLIIKNLAEAEAPQVSVQKLAQNYTRLLA